LSFEIRKIADVGTGHPVVARLGMQTVEVLGSFGVDKGTRDAISGLYIHTLTPRLLRCHQARDEIVRLMNESIGGITQQDGSRMREVPHVINLEGLVAQFLYEAKNYIRDLLGLFETVYGCRLKDASAFADMKNKGECEFVKWANEKFGAQNSLSEMVMTDQGWIGEVIRSRNAVEHPGGLSGTLTIQNIRLDPQRAGAFIAPTWQRTGNPENSIVEDMDCGLENLLTLGEDLLIEVVKRGERAELISFYLIPVEERRPECPVRIRASFSPEVLAKFPGKI
jgi:hypothetical protein